MKSALSGGRPNKRFQDVSEGFSRLSLGLLNRDIGRMTGHANETEEAKVSLLKTAIIVIAIAIAGPLFWSFRLVPEGDFVVGVTAFSIGVVTFFSIANLNGSAEGSIL